MKGGGGGGYLYNKHGLKMKQLSLFFVIFVCASLVLWNWDKTPHLTALLPPDDQPLHLFPVEVERKQDTRVKPEAEQAPPSLSTDFNTPQTSHLENTKLLVDKSISEPKELSETTAKQQSVTSQRTESTVIDTPMAKAETKACNFGKGKWVPADNRPLYSGFGCKQWLSGMWACRLTQRTDFGYEKLKWQPKDCKMDDFTGAEFLKRMQDKTLAFVGDSLGRQQFQSIMCMVTGGEEMPDVEDVGKEFGLAKAQGSARPDGWAYRFPTTNTTILYYWSASLCHISRYSIRAAPGMQDCLHWCLPGVPDTWNEVLFAQI
ncbi:putative PMR5 domain, PC-Esterase [Helianthus annuus]|nr:putative PMR5 domain, PC-Esterase [Helianthus annuus]